MAYTPSIAICFTLNYIIGSGFLTLPWAFQQAGLVLSVIVMMIFMFFSILAVLFTLEAMARANILDAASNIDKTLKQASQTHGFAHVTSFEMKTYNSLQSESSHHEVQSSSLENKSLEDDSYVSVNENDLFNQRVQFVDDVAFRYHASSHKHEITELCSIFLGERGKQAYALCVGIYMYLTLWAYSSVFSNSFSTRLPVTMDKESSYYIYLTVLTLIVLPLSVMEFKEQTVLQVILSVFRILLIVMMLTTIFVGMAFHDKEFQLLATDNDYHGPNLFNFDHLYSLLPLAAFGYIFHHSIPSISQPIVDKKSLILIFTIAIFISFIAYTLLSIVMASYLGDKILVSSNIVWKYYSGIHTSGHSTSGTILHVMARIVSLFIVLFPAIDVASAFPLNAFTLGNNLMTAYYGADMYKHRYDRWKLTLFRLLAAVPPIFAAGIVQDLGKITDLAGLNGFALAFIFPPLLGYFSKKKFESLGLNSVTIHSSYLTSEPFIWLLMVSGGVLFIYVAIQLLRTNA